MGAPFMSCCFAGVAILTCPSSILLRTSATHDTLNASTLTEPKTGHYPIRRLFDIGRRKRGQAALDKRLTVETQPVSFLVSN